MHLLENALKEFTGRYMKLTGFSDLAKIYIYIYIQWRPSSQCHRAMALVVLCPAPKFGAYFECLVTKYLKAPKWHWLILDPMGALVNSQT